MLKNQRQVFVGLGISLLLLTSLRAQSSPAASDVARRRLAHLRRGINASEWFAQVYDPKGYGKEHFESWNTSQDIALIQSLGFDHVRLSVNPQPMFRSGHADEISPEYLGYLDAAVKMILDQGLAVVIDVHPESDFKTKLANEDEFVEQFADYWRSFAHHYSILDADRVFFEILNEPELRDRYRWSGMQVKLAAAIREGAPQNTIIATGARYSSDDELLFLDPLPDRNVIYNFHFYEPHVFTHQGATWGVNYWHWEKGLSYPSNRESADKVAAKLPDAMSRLYILRYGMEHWDAARIDMEIDQVAEWAKLWNVPLVCNEFGVYRKYVNPQDRAAWIHDVRSSLERHNIGWAMWDYSGGFGVVNKANGKVVADGLTLTALGLN